MAGVGIDLLEIARLERALERRPGLAKRLFTDAELDHASVRARPGRHLAARFCAKEAVVKALRLDCVPWQEIEVVNDDGGAPRVRLAGSLAGHDGTVLVSLTHSDTMAGAVAFVGQ